MPETQLLRIKKLSAKHKLNIASKHNLREIQKELGADRHINPNLTHLNLLLRGPSTAIEIVDKAEQLIKEAGITRMRKDAVWAVEYIISLSPITKINSLSYFEDSATWIENYTGCPILSATVHLDEAAPHMHILLLPLIDGKMNGGRLVGYKTQLASLQKEFYREVSKRYGLAEASTLTGHQKGIVATNILRILKEDPYRICNPDVQNELKRLIKGSPYILKDVLQIPDPEVSIIKKTFTGIMTSKGKGSSRPESEVYAL